MLGLRGSHTYIVLNEIHQRLCRLRLSNWTPVFDLCHFESSFVCAATRCDTGLSTLFVQEQAMRASVFTVGTRRRRIRFHTLPPKLGV